MGWERTAPMERPILITVGRSAQHPEELAPVVTMKGGHARSSSALDVREVATADAKHRKLSNGSVATASARGVRAVDLGLDDLEGSAQIHEDDAARVVVVCDPGLPKSMGALHPAAALYEKPVNMDKAVQEHAHFREVLRAKGLKVLTVKEILNHGAEELRCRSDLEDLAMKSLRYRTDKEYPLEGDHEKYISDEYKRHVLEAMSVDQLIDVVLTCPTVFVRPSFRDTGLTAAYEFEPLTNRTS